MNLRLFICIPLLLSFSHNCQSSDQQKSPITDSDAQYYKEQFDHRETSKKLEVAQEKLASLRSRIQTQQQEHAMLTRNSDVQEQKQKLQRLQDLQNNFPRYCAVKLCAFAKPIIPTFVGGAVFGFLSSAF